MEFLSITLPTFAKDFERSLELGYIADSCFQGFARKRIGSENYPSPVLRPGSHKMGTQDLMQSPVAVPRFLSGFTQNVFHPLFGYLLDNSNREGFDPLLAGDCVQAIRQICLMFAKIDLPCSDARVSAALSQFIQTDRDVAKFDNEWTSIDFAEFSRVSNFLFSDTFSRIDRDVYEGNVVPRHGPGATADKLKGNKKYSQSEWPERLDQVFPCGEYLLPNWRHHKSLRQVNILESGTERPVRVITVPKTHKTPRIIAIEPTAMQYMQQALREKFYEAIEGDELLSNFIGFTSQPPNQRMALEGSLYGKLATLDLSEASDRVSYRHVSALFSRTQHLNEAVFAVRSEKADVDGHGIIPLSKYASMGSALTFPIEAMVFLTVIIIGIEKSLGTRITQAKFKRLVGKVRVYGDDIIVPVEHVYHVIESLEAHGLKVNINKSFWTGKFRESCGKEYYDGTDVSIVRCRRKFPANMADVQEVVSLISMRNQFYWSGMWKTAAWLDSQIAPLLGDVYPRIKPTSSAQGRHSVLEPESQKMSKTLHKPLVRGYVVKSTIPVNSLDDIGALLKWFHKRGDEPYAEDHLERSGRPVAVSIKLQWVCPF